MRKFTRIASVLAASIGALMFVGCTKDFSEDIDQLESRVKTLEDDTAVEALQTKVSALEGLSSSFVKVSQYTTDLAGINTAITGANSEIGALKTRIEAVESDLVSFKALVGANDIDFNRAISNINDALKDYAKKTDVATEVQSLTTLIGEVKAMFADYTPVTSFSQLSQQFSELSTVVSENSSSISNNATAIAALQTLLEGVDGAVKALAITVSEEDGKLAQLISNEVAGRTAADGELSQAIENAKASLQAQLDNIANVELPAIKADIALCLKTADFEAAKAILEQSIQSVSNSVSALENTVSVNKTLSESADNNLQGQIGVINTTIGEIKSTLATMQRDIDTRATKVELDAQVAILQGEIDNINNTVIPALESVVEANYAELDGRIKNIVADIVEMKETLETKAVVSELAGTVSALQQTVAENWASFTEFKDAQEALNSGYEAKLQEHSEAIEALQGRVTSLEARVAALEDGLGAANGNISELEGKIAIIETIKLAEIWDAINACITTVDAQALVNAVDARCDGLSADLTTLQLLVDTKASTTDLTNKVTEILGKIGALKSEDISTLNTYIEGIKAENQEIDATIGQLSSTLTSLQTSVNGLTSADIKDFTEAVLALSEKDREALAACAKTLEESNQDFSARLEILEAKLNVTGESAPENLQQVNAVLASLKDELAKLAKRVSAAEEKIDNIIARVSTIASVPQLGVELAHFTACDSYDFYTFTATYQVLPISAAASIDTSNTVIRVKSGLNKRNYSTDAEKNNINEDFYHINKIVNSETGEITVYAQVKCYTPTLASEDVASYYSLIYKGTETVETTGEKSDYYVISDFEEASQTTDAISLNDTKTYIFVNDKKDSVGTAVADSAVYTDTAVKTLLKTGNDNIAICYTKGKALRTLAEIKDLYGIEINPYVNHSLSYSDFTYNQKWDKVKDTLAFTYAASGDVKFAINPVAGRYIADQITDVVTIDSVVVAGVDTVVTVDSPAQTTVTYKVIPSVNENFKFKTAQEKWDWKQCDTVRFDKTFTKLPILYSVVEKFGKNEAYITFDKNSSTLSNAKGDAGKITESRIYVPDGAVDEVRFTGIFKLYPGNYYPKAEETTDSVHVFTGVAGWSEANAFFNTEEHYLDSVLYRFDCSYALAKRPTHFIQLREIKKDVFLGQTVVLRDTIIGGEDGVLGKFLYSNALNSYYNYNKQTNEPAEVLNTYKNSGFFYSTKNFVADPKNKDNTATLSAKLECASSDSSIFTTEFRCRKYESAWFYDTTYVFGVPHVIARVYKMPKPTSHLFSPIKEYIGEDKGDKNYEVEVKSYVSGGNFIINTAQLAHYFTLTDTVTTQMEAAGVKVVCSVDPKAAEPNAINYPEELQIFKGKDKFKESTPIAWVSLDTTSFETYVRFVDGYDNTIDSLTINFWTADPVAEKITVKSVEKVVPSMIQSTKVDLSKYVDINVTYNLYNNDGTTTVTPTSMFTLKTDKSGKPLSGQYVCPTLFNSSNDKTRGFSFAIAESSKTLASNLGLTVENMTLTLPVDHAVLTEDVTIHMVATFQYQFGTRTANFDVVFTPGN